MQTVNTPLPVSVNTNQDIDFIDPADLVDAVQKALINLQKIKKPSVSNSPFSTMAPAVRRALKTPIIPVRYISRIYNETKQQKAQRIRREMIDAGVTLYGLMKSETRILPKVLHPNEHIEGVVYGQHHSNSVMLVATNERILYVDKKPMALFLDEVSYEVVSGIEFEIHTLFATLILHTPVKNYDIRFANLRCAENFARHIEIERLAREQHADTQPSANLIENELRQSSYSQKPKEGLAGYVYLGRNEEEELIP